MPDAVSHIEDKKRRRSRLALAAVMLGAGTMHFVNPKFYDPMVPETLPGSVRAWVYGSGVAEVAAGVLVANRRTERLGAWASLAVFVGIYPGNIYDAIQHPPIDARGIGRLLRLPLQFPLFLWALRLTRPETPES